MENNHPIVQTYSVERPASTASEAIYNEIVYLSAKYGLNTDIALRIAQAESNFHQYNDNGSLLRGVVNPADVGVFQINERYHLERSQALGLDIHNTHDNIEYAMWLLKNEGNRHWLASKAKWGNA
ncbi:MAG: transglycosylase SLT domain-containing protein [Candidatus Vogelbacteria bacterium]|nr:transglycosylase SLT domain-containing protein [Candidatus Vogelbacteria bacterium]